MPERATSLPSPKSHPTNQCTRIAKLRLIETGWAYGGVLALKVALPARNRVISSVSGLGTIRNSLA